MFVLKITRKQSDGYWKEWYNSSECSITCGEGGTVQQKRECHKPTGFGLDNCVGNDTQMVPCIIVPCMEGKNVFL